MFVTQAVHFWGKLLVVLAVLCGLAAVAGFAIGAPGRFYVWVRPFTVRDVELTNVGVLSYWLAAGAVILIAAYFAFLSAHVVGAALVVGVAAYAARYAHENHAMKV